MLARETETPALQHTPLHALHLARGGKMVPFAGYDMPVQYAAGVLKEHLHTRAAAGLFDVSHMGQIALRPKSGRVEDAARALERLVPQDIVAQRVNATATTTVMPKSVCVTCHGVLTPLATQRLRWADDGTYHATDDAGAPIDDSDRNLVPDYPYKGQGMGAFATQAVEHARRDLACTPATPGPRSRRVRCSPRSLPSSASRR